MKIFVVNYFELGDCVRPETNSSLKQWIWLQAFCLINDLREKEKDPRHGQWKMTLS